MSMSQFCESERDVTVVYWGLVRSALKLREESLRVPAGATVRAVLAALRQRHGNAFEDAVFTADGTLVSNAMLLLDGRNVASGALDAPLQGAASLHILLTTNAMAGG